MLCNKGVATRFPPTHRESPRCAHTRRNRSQISSMTHTNISFLEQQLRQQALGNLEEQQCPTLTVVPLRHHKVLHLIRHGEGFHNVAGRIDHETYKSWEYEDSHLTDYGWKQAKAVQQHIKQMGIKVDIVIVSPLTRALETAVGCFGNFSAPLNGTPPLMMELTEQQGRRAAHPAVSAEGCPPIVCYELCREHLGVHPCDRRHSTWSKAAMFPGVDFSLITDEHDVLWDEHHRETREEIRQRGRQFMAQVMARPETNIAVVSHSSFLHFMLTNFGHNASTTVSGELHRWFENCELHSIVVCDEKAQHKQPDPLHFPGFAPVVNGALVVEGPQA
eukprot:GHUV01009749.1.p1 GENE.GHUV01009749.1~~GHUV01009749.1.p1  ORF type:complete len:333 (+),score=54.98 GHUV01009749.1:140-1138(+)